MLTFIVQACLGASKTTLVVGTERSTQTTWARSTRKSVGTDGGSVSTSDGICHFCNTEGLAPFGADLSIIMRAGSLMVTWCGICREGSRLRFAELLNEELKKLIEESEVVLAEHELTYDQARWIQDEIFRGKQELTYRIMEGL